MMVNDMSIQLRYWRRDKPPSAPSDMSPVQRVAARIDPRIPSGWRLLEPEAYDGGWRLQIQNIEDPVVSVAAWDADLEEALNSLEHPVRAMRK